jgi:uncharacterized protein
MQFKQAGNFIVNRLKKELSANYIYHNIDHTNDVYNAAENIGRLEKISDADMKLLLTAALYHDAGFLRFSKGHEEESCRMAAEVLPGYGYTEMDINLICGMIRATRVPQSPKTLLERILVDADLDYIGRDDFFDVGHRLFKELSLTGAIGDEMEWDKLQLDFMEGHSYFTKTAIDLREAKKQANMAQIKAQLLNHTTK